MGLPQSVAAMTPSCRNLAKPKSAEWNQTKKKHKDKKQLFDKH